MAELLFVATTIFVAYVLFEVVADNKGKPESGDALDTPPPPPKDAEIEQTQTAVSVSAPPSTPVPVAPPVKTSSKPAAKKPAAKSKATTTPKPVAAGPALARDQIKNPKTGEIVKITGNYAFVKRWIKEALVEEGLLDKIYKNNELDDETHTKIQSALDQLKSMEKYR
ncbi:MULTISPECIES: hypothetical protein [Methylomonas]|uniref:hypothetical protein n=1 Tax=Methylomonas TaxID=416 RepID=UPI001231A769|nr:hypothetical protein [Methylomonas rhizoryzae]